MSTLETAADVVKFHISLNTGNLFRSLAFYRVLFGVEPAKVRGDYAKFELAEPPVVLSLIPIPPSSGGHMNHVGLRLLDSAALVAVQLRLEQAGFATQREEGVECCYSKQTKFWVQDPDGALWELYVLHGDADEHDEHNPSRTQGLTGNSTFRGRLNVLQPTTSAALPSSTPQATAVVWQHLLTQPLPERIDLADGSVDDVQLLGTLNMKLERARVSTFMQEVRRVLRPGGTIGAHALTSDRPLPEKPVLPGPASLVEHVWTETEASEFFAEAGFVGVRFVKLGEKPCFTVGEAQLRETRLAASAPAAEPCAEKTVDVLYRGPWRELHDDYGNIFPRGRRVRVTAAQAAALAAMPHAGEFLSFGGAAPSGGCCS
ncbi:MAG: VOC family protein [Planctomycetia bacterium]|nr:VOC family protein [Planctomycetia bacterium]